MRGRWRAGFALALGAASCTADSFPLGDSPDIDVPDALVPDALVPDLGAPGARFPEGCLPVRGYLLCLRPTVFDEARDLCRGAGGELLTIETEEENQLVGRFVAEWTPSQVWFGLTDRAVEDEWRWLDGALLGPFSGWTPDEPNDLEGEDCAHLNWETEGGWNDIDCEDRYGAVCELVDDTEVRCRDDRDCVLSYGRCQAGSCVVQPP